jgi:hypothetical protein
MAEQAGQIAHSLFQGYLGPDHRIMDMQSFYRYTRPTPEAGRNEPKPRVWSNIRRFLHC